METMQSIEEPMDIFQRLSSTFMAEINILPTEDEKRIARKAMETMNTPLYGTATHFETGSEDMAHQVHTRVRNEGMYILLLDRAYEQEDVLSRQHAESQHQKILSDLLPQQQEQLLALEKKLFTFWDIEKDMRQRMRSGIPVSENELHEFILRKSTDVFLYATIARFSVALPREVLLEFYMHQLLRDVEDDFKDLEEDSNEQMPNPLLLRLWRHGTYDFTRSCEQKELESLTKETGIFTQHSSFVRSYCQRISGRLPEKYLWMRQCAGVEI